MIGWLRRHGNKLWWLHSAWAMGLGVFVVTFAREGFDHARWLTVSLVAVWLVTLTLFRVFGSGRDRQLDSDGARVGYLVMTYVLKNLYQGMLFFALPFYWESATLDAPNAGFVAALAACALLSTADLVFDRVLMRFRVVAATFYVFVLFAALNLAVPALVPGVDPVHGVYAGAAAAAVAFFTLHMPPSGWRSGRGILALVLGALAAALSAGAAPEVIPPVPLRVVQAGVGFETLPDGRLTATFVRLHSSRLAPVTAVIDIARPAADPRTTDLKVVWRREGHPIERATPRVDWGATTGALRLRASFDGWPDVPAGRWSADVVTTSGQLVGRARFTVFE